MACRANSDADSVASLEHRSHAAQQRFIPTCTVAHRLSAVYKEANREVWHNDDGCMHGLHCARSRHTSGTANSNV